jgi:isopenicillin-N N-acyltransferase-like protein
LLLGVGDGKLQTDSFRGFQYSHSVLNVFSDTNLQPLNETWHPRLQNIVYWGMDWLCPSYNQRFSEQLHEHYGNISAEVTISHILPSIDSGNLQAVIYDLTDNFVYVAYGFVKNNKTKVNAFDRPFVALNMTELFN